MREQVISPEFFLQEDSPDVPVSYNLIVKGNPAAVETCVDSVYGAIYREGDECVVVDTGSTDEDFEEIKNRLARFPSCRVLDHRQLSVDYAPLCQKYLNGKLYEQYAEVIKDGRGILSFAEARNIALEASTNNVIFWIDSDDVLGGGEQNAGEVLRKAVNWTFSKTPITQIFMDYDYEFGEDGVCTTTLRRERFFLKDRFQWKGNCHETAIPRPGKAIGQMGYYEAVKARVIHTKERKPAGVSDVRNYLILREELERTKGGNVDPRTVFYLANAARGLEMFREARGYYNYFDQHSGSVDDRYAAHYYQSQIFMDPRIQRPFDAMTHCFKCIELKPKDPRGYFALSRVYAALCRWEECVQWYDTGRNLAIPADQIFSHDPTHVHYHPHVVAAHAYKELRRSKEALDCTVRAYRFRPDLPEAREMVQSFENNHRGEELGRAIACVGNNTHMPGGIDARRVVAQICDELQAVPPSIEEAGVSKLEPLEGREPKPDVNFFCGGMGEPWGPFSRRRGIGGSEKMVIMLSEALQRTGKVNVNVYGEVPHPARGVSAETGVNWRHWSEFDEKRPRDVMVYWRNPGAVTSLRCPAKQRIIWNHDVQNPKSYTDEVLAIADLVQFQSKYHTKAVRGVIPEGQIWIARNAIEPPVLSKRAPQRDPKRVLYCSSPDRGLLTAIEIVRRARKIDPEIKLTVTYGVTPWARKAFASQNHRYIPDIGRDGSMDEFERSVFAALDEVDAVNLNRVGFDQMSYLMSNSGVWLYPTRFPEISCMSAMETCAHGMVPLATRYGALEETIPDIAFPHLPALPENGDIPGEWFDAAAEMLVKAVNVPEHAAMRRALAKVAYQKYNIDDLAQQWLGRLGLSSGSAAPEAAQAPIVPAAEPISSSKE